MWRNLSFKKQLILILLIPVSGLLYFTIININDTYQKYLLIKNSSERIDNIAVFAEGVMLINNERTLNEYSKFNPNKKDELKLSETKTLEWFSKINSTDSVVLKNIDVAKKIINTIHYNTKQDAAKSSLNIFNEYSALNNILNNLIEREIANCDNSNLGRLANNLKSYIDSKSAANLIRAIVFDKLTDDTIHNDLYGYYDNIKNLNKNADFKLENYNNLKINDEIIRFKKSAEFQSFLSTSESILHNSSKINPEAWWHQSTAVNDKLNT